MSGGDRADVGWHKIAPVAITNLVMDAVNDLDQANMVVAIAAGNSGPGHFTIESPGSAERALTAGASSVGHFRATSPSSVWKVWLGRPSTRPTTAATRATTFARCEQ